MTNKQYWSARIADIEPYVPGEQPRDRKFIKLNTNENPYPPSPKVLEAVRAAADSSLRLYPDPDASGLCAALARHYGIPADHVFAGNGSDEVLSCAFLAFTDEKTPAVFPDISYSFYPVYAALYGTKTVIEPLNDDFTMPVEALSRNNGTVLLANPNAPTSIALPLSVIEQILQADHDHVVVVDEAYVDFGAESAVCLIDRYPNLLVVQTFSKSRALAGQRCGMAFGCADLIAAMNAVKNSFNSYTIDRVAQAAATAAVEDEAYFEQTRHAVMATRARTAAALQELGFAVLPSASNFLFVSHPKKPAADLFAALREEGILVRYFAKPRISNYLRITIGTDEEMDALVRALKEML